MSRHDTALSPAFDAPPGGDPSPSEQAGDASSVPPGLDRRERRKAETRRRLLESARALFVDRGYDATRPQDIAREADVAAGTFYLHFPDKRAAFVAVTEEAADSLIERITRVGAREGTFGTGLRTVLAEILTFTQEEPGLVRMLFADEAVISAGPSPRPNLRERLARGLAGGLRERMESGEFHDDYPVDGIAHGIVGLIQQALVYSDVDGAARESLLDALVLFCTRALVREPTQECTALDPAPNPEAT